jgi:hypothetical protein
MLGLALVKSVLHTCPTASGSSRSLATSGLITLFTRNASVVSDAPHSKNAGRFGTSCGARPIQLFEGSRPWVQQTLWNLNRFWSQKPCQTGSLAKRLLLILIELLLLATICVILPPAPSVLQEGRSTLASIHAKASAAKRLRSKRISLCQNQICFERC